MAEHNLLSSIVQIIPGTPTWVWIIFGYLVFVGVKATKPRIVYIPKLFIIPAFLSGLKYKIFLAGSFWIWVGYFICLLLPSFLSFKFSAMQKVEVIKESMSVKLPGTYWTVIILISFFVVKYIFGYISAKQPTLYQELEIFEFSISGMLSGYFLGKAIHYLNLFKKESME